MLLNAGHSYGASSRTRRRWRKLPRRFYLQPTLRVARELPGKLLVYRRGRTVLAGRIVEVEAYLGSRDPASHAFRGMTKRNEVMFHEEGHLYVYFTYGMHFCCNVVTGPEGVGQAVLLRAVEPVRGIAAMIRNRRTASRERRPGIDEKTIENLCNGPGKLCEAFGITRGDNGADLCGTRIWIAEDEGSQEPLRIDRSRRIGISAGRRHPWRFYVKGSRFVSKGKPVDR